MKQNISLKRLFFSLLSLVIIIPVLITSLILLYGNVFKNTTTYDSHNTQIPYPLPLIKNKEKTALIKRGEYLAKIGNCISCHTDSAHPDKAFSGGVLIDTPFGQLFSTNITPDNKTGIGEWNLKEFILAMTKGIAPDGKHYFPAFPYPYFSLLKTKDLKALFLYLKAIPPVPQKNKPNHFPYNLPFARTSMRLWNDVFMPRKREVLTRGAYLVNGLGHCSLCHTPLNMFGAPKTDYFLAGRFIGGYWAPNITAKGLEKAGIDDIVRAFDENQLFHDAGPLRGPMTEVTLNSLRYLSLSDKQAIAHYLKSVKSDSPLSVTPSNNPPALTRGKVIYKKVCVICHQNGTMGAPRLGNGHGWLSRIQRHGLNTLYDRTINGFNSMPVMGACVGCSNNDVKAAVDYMIYQSLPYSKWQTLRKNRTQEKS